MSADTDKWAQWLEAIEDRGVSLTSWEIGFIEDMRVKFDRWGTGVHLSDNQADQLERIYVERVP